MTIAGGIFPLIIADAVNNLFIHSLTLCISFLLSFLFLSFPVFPPSPLFQPSSSPFCSFSNPPSSSLIPSPLLAPLSLDAPSSLFRSAAAGKRVATANHPSFLHPGHCFLPRTCSPHFHMFKHSHPILATPPSSSSSSSSSFSPALLSSEF